MTRMHVRAKTSRPHLRDERGMALVLTLSMLAILSVLGAFALSTTNTELGVTANFRSSRESFLAAERIIEYAKALVIDSEPEGFVPLAGTDHQLNIDLSEHGSMDGEEENSITYVAEGSGPEAYYGKKDAGDVLGVYFRVSATGQSSTERSKTRLETTFFAVTKVGTNDDGNLID